RTRALEVIGVAEPRRDPTDGRPEEGQGLGFLEVHGLYSKTTVLLPYTSTRCRRWRFTARASTTFSRSRPLRTRSSTESRWLTRATSCSMIGPSSRSEVT